MHHWPTVGGVVHVCHSALRGAVIIWMQLPFVRYGHLYFNRRNPIYVYHLLGASYETDTVTAKDAAGNFKNGTLGFLLDQM